MPVSRTPIPAVAIISREIARPRPGVTGSIACHVHASCCNGDRRVITHWIWVVNRVRDVRRHVSDISVEIEPKELRYGYIRLGCNGSACAR